ncbi:glycoside hydrolase [Microbacterium sp. CFH 31415]|uniref:glycosyl hydrolase n=1 Tax=Microbacterium sp. CFH 31415 TaxID=2921732 RepID=UPI001F1405D7|nr:glycosyl hydrolase [Microbacterium sp. CFH 31415]MCH6230917.1 glycoside hydrolase [Microbacterium sp. CFH 31415]
MPEILPSKPTPAALWNRFLRPPDDARPRAWWHWMDGNVDPEGIVRDLTWLHSVGVRGVQLFDGGMGVPLVVPEPVRPGSAAWSEAIQTAMRTASDLGLELAVATSAGWSAAGGPWVEPRDAMKKIVWSEAIVEGGGRRTVTLPPLPDAAGLFQDARRWGAAPREPWATDWRVVGFPADDAHDVLRPDRVGGSAPLADVACLTDGSFEAALELPRDPDRWSSAWLELQFDEPVTVRAVTVGLPGPRGFGAAPPPDAVLEADDDATGFRTIAHLEATSVPARTVAFAPVTARRFRLILSGASAAEALPPVADGVRMPPVLRRSDAFLVSEFALREGGRIHHAETKAGFGVVRDYYAVDTDARADAAAVRASDVHDLTALVRDGRLDWDAPPGRWRVLRLGASLTGQTNGPALVDATGLEVDKLDGARVEMFLQRHLTRFEAEGFDALLSDSIEAGSQNWTDRITERFQNRRGYDPTPWLPTLAGYLVDDGDCSDRFLYDYRRTLAELLSGEYYATLAAEAHRRGMRYYAEALEDRRPQLGDDLAMRSHADVPMGAMWTFDPEAGPRPTYVADLKGAASVAHVHGKRWTGSEAFTSFDRPWASSPRTLKHVADLQLALGVTRFCIHTSPHQPLAAPPPGVALAPFLGQAFTATETWAGMAGPWIDYLARCSAVLSAGEPAVDVAVFVGEEAPVTALFGDEFDTTVPDGFDFDYVDAEGLALLRVDVDGTLRSAGARYRLLVLGGSSRRLTVSALRHLERLADAGATVVGLPPQSTPSLADDEVAFRRLRDAIWAGARQPGHVISTSDLAGAFASLGLRSDFELTGAPVRTIARIVDGQRVTFLANPSHEDARVRFSVPQRVGALSAWDPIELRATPLSGELTQDGRTVVELVLPPFGSVFVVPAGWAAQEEPASDGLAACRVVPLRGDQWALSLPGRDEIALPRPALWTELDDEARGFSGTAIYRSRFEQSLPLDDARVWVDLGRVHDVARVVVNGVDCGVAWTAPFRVDVTSALREGANVIQVEVATPWRNRLIAGADRPTGQIFPPMTTVFEPFAEPLPAGLAGPVVLLRENPV